MGVLVAVGVGVVGVEVVVGLGRVKGLLKTDRPAVVKLSAVLNWSDRRAGILGAGVSLGATTICLGSVSGSLGTLY